MTNTQELPTVRIPPDSIRHYGPQLFELVGSYPEFAGSGVGSHVMINDREYVVVDTAIGDWPESQGFIIVRLA
jgi:hypothetical protein